MELILKSHMRGLVRVPAMCILDPEVPLATSNLSKYEVSPVEPLHDMKGLIKNVWEILPTVMRKDLEDFFETELDNILGKVVKEFILLIILKDYCYLLSQQAHNVASTSI